MSIEPRLYTTVESFEQFIEQPENSDKLFEYIAGEIVEVPSNPFVSKIAGLIITFFNIYLFDNDIGHVTGEAGGYMVSGERYAPDVAFISYAKQRELEKDGYNPNPPDLAVEVISSNRTDELDKLRIKITNYHAAGTLVWVVKPAEQLVEEHAVGKKVKIIRMGDSLSGGDILPNFTLKLSDIFRS
ncbi:MAG: Uma2 family endonuclease [Aggregatilineales bacterium]